MMTERYDLRSQEDLDTSQAYLPGTAPGEFVRHNMTPMKSNLAPGREIPGCHPSRWIYELLHNNFTACDIFERARRANLDMPYPWEHEHKLVVNGNQSFATNSSRLLSSVCLDCHFHFVFKMSWEEAHAEDSCHPKHAGWPQLYSNFPWHHLVWANSDSQPNTERDHSKYYPLVARENFVCSSQPCTFQVVLEISVPRMQTWWVKLLTDQDAIRQRLQVAREQEPSRYESATDDWASQAPLNLNTYLKNLLETTPEDVRSISKRNKRFAVLFGPRCFNIFKELEFSEQIQITDGVDEGSFTPSVPAPPSGMWTTTEIGSFRGYLEDVRAEVQCLIHRAGQPGERPSFCVSVLHDYLGCQELPITDIDALVNIERYKLLGVLPNQPKEVVVNAYMRQWDLLPGKRRALLDALIGVANDLNDERFSDYAMTQSSLFDSQLQQQGTTDDDDAALISEALRFIGLQPPNNYSPDDLIKAFRQKLLKEPGEAETARSMLQLIARSSTNDTYQAMLLMETDARMSLATSKVILELEEAFGFGPEALESARSKIQSAGTKAEKETFLDAMAAIADHTNSLDLKREVAELRQQNGITVQDTSLLDSARDQPVNFDLPAGLENIGNTCYLNSLLQYLFTVKPVRDIALNYDDFKLDLTDESIQTRLIGGNKMQMDRGEAVVAQAFARELSELFHNLQSTDRRATRPSQRLANAVLLSTHTLLKDLKPTSETALEPPPLPARPSPAPPTYREDTDMINVSVNAVQDSVETASTVSSQTLVEHGDVDSDRSYEKIDTSGHSSESKVIEVELGGTQQDVMMRETLLETEDVDSQKVTTADTDTNMVDMEEPQTVDQRVLTALEHQERSSGTDQQDVEEVIGSIINRLQAAIRPSHVDQATGIQLERIMETFFVTTINYTKKFEEPNYQEEISFDRSITAFPAPQGACSLYDALARNFDQQIIEESKLSRYTAIKTLPPVLHVLIQRSQSIGSKNKNPVTIPETLYLDRFMDAPHDSPEFQKRGENWVIADRVSDLKSLKAEVEVEGSSGQFLEDYLDSKSEEQEPNTVSFSDEAETAVSATQATEETWDFDGPVEDDFLLIAQPQKGLEAAGASTPPAKPENIQTTEQTIKDMMDGEIKSLEEGLGQYFGGLTNTPYRLHAVICHSGDLRAGHYWVWIRDFEQNLWHKYNDSNVEANRNTDEVLNKLSSSGEPYYLCFVRDGDKDEFVGVPKRQVPEPQPDILETEGALADDSNGDFGVSSIEALPSPNTPPVPNSLDTD